ncbi:hypothetical protein PHLCEN_2v2757 [Hermanssonia centrifuga]|uniref:Uncharacterized protein n=1 Tax=Hermanssonia centrifuga TaxID=98765 RepID=A0A2R6RHX1_9APHY|nr:hypothetical protein PHLCEN_2v2757 [Hermanssonia centrifuga]
MPPAISRVRTSGVTGGRTNVGQQSQSMTAEPVEQKPQELHCVRCHSAFYNENERCIIPHVFKIQCWHGASEIHRETLTYGSACCGETATVTIKSDSEADVDREEDADRGDDLDPSPCFQGTHTTSVTSGMYNDVNLFRCHWQDQGGRCERKPLSRGWRGIQLAAKGPRQVSVLEAVGLAEWML